MVVEHLYIIYTCDSNMGNSVFNTISPKATRSTIIIFPDNIRSIIIQIIYHNDTSPVSKSNQPNNTTLLHTKAYTINM